MEHAGSARVEQTLRHIGITHALQNWDQSGRTQGSSGYSFVMAKTHPHVDSPDRQELVAVTMGRPEKLIEVYLALHELILDTVPTIQNSVDAVDAAIGYGAHQFGYNGWGVAAVTPFSKWVSLTFFQGSRLADPGGLLVGNAVMRHVKLQSLQELTAKREEIRLLIVEAAELNA